MKKALLLVFAALITLAACNKEDGEVIFEATLANNHAKITMDAQNRLSWEAGDLVRLGYLGHSTVFEVAFDNQENRAHLHQKYENDDKHVYRNAKEIYALYPGDSNLNINNTITYDTTKNKFYKVNSLGTVQLVSDSCHYDRRWLVCTATHKESNIPASGNRTVKLVFHNCMALLKCTIDEGCTNIYQLKVTAANTGAYIGGHAWVSACDAGVNLDSDPRTNSTISTGDKKYSITLKHENNTALTPGDYYIAIWSDYYNETNVASTPSMNTADYAKNTTKKNVAITPCDANGATISSYGSYTVASYSFFRNTIYPVGTFPKSSNSTGNKTHSIFR